MKAAQGGQAAAARCASGWGLGSPTPARLPRPSRGREGDKGSLKGCGKTQIKQAIRRQSWEMTDGKTIFTWRKTRARILRKSRHSRARLSGGTGAVRDKYQRAHGGCLGSRRRRRARQAAKSRGEARTADDPRVPEWGNPASRRLANLI